MCGITGAIGVKDLKDPAQIIRSMNNALSHRGPDAEGYYIKDHVALGHRRLSIIDLSTAANQPFTDTTGRFILVFNGEIYNYKEIKAELPLYPFSTHSDTEVVLAAYTTWGPACLHKLKGMFAFAIWDSIEEKLFAARDRFGVKPFYYFFKKELFLFASEIRAILKSGLVKRKVDRQALSDYLKYQSVISPLTLVQGVFQLEAGHYLNYNKGEVVTTQYWSIEDAAEKHGDDKTIDTKTRVRDLLYQAVERRLVADVPVGAFLSGGIDSSAIVAIMAEVSIEKPIAFTIGFKEQKYDETPFAELVANKYGVVHHKIMMSANDFLEELPSALNAMDTPSGDGLNTYVVSKAIREQGIKVALSGIGGDELFVGYPIFKQFHQLYKYKNIFAHTQYIRSGIGACLPGGNQKWDRIKEMMQSKTASISEIYPMLRKIQTQSNIERLADLGADNNKSGTLEGLLKKNQRQIEKLDSFGQVSVADYYGYTQNVLLKDADQMSMAVALEIREPFFDSDLCEYVVGLNNNAKGTQYPKQLLVDSLQPLVPKEVVFRKKMGFVLPYDVWLRNALQSFCEEKITNLSKRSYFNGQRLNSYWQQFLKGESKIRWADIWIFVVLENWLQENGME